MHMDLTSLENTIKLAKKYKLRSLSVEDVSFEFRDPIPRKTTRAATQKEIPVVGEKMPSDEEMLFASSDSLIEFKDH